MLESKSVCSFALCINVSGEKSLWRHVSMCLGASRRNPFCVYALCSLVHTLQQRGIIFEEMNVTDVPRDERCLSDATKESTIFLEGVNVIQVQFLYESINFLMNFGNLIKDASQKAEI